MIARQRGLPGAVELSGPSGGDECLPLLARKLELTEVGMFGVAHGHGGP
jgi:hypothetical protein